MSQKDEKKQVEKSIGPIGYVGMLVVVVGSALWLGGSFSGNSASIGIGIVITLIGLLLRWAGKKK